MESRDVGIESARAGRRMPAKKDARKTATTAAAAEERGTLFGTGEKENERRIRERAGRV